MYSVSEDRPRGSSPGHLGREFPVLFHLMDVSRPRATKPTETIDSANLLSAVEQLHWPPTVESEQSPPSTAVPMSVATSNDTTPSGETPQMTPADAEAVLETAENVPTNDDGPAPPAAEQPSSEEAVAVSEVESPAPRPVPLVALRTKHRTSASEDWFAAHGKYIAVAFVLALVATIYFARANREQASIAKQETTSQPPLLETTPAVAATGQPANGSSRAVPTVQTASAAAPATSSPVELRAPQMVEPSTDKPKDNLFEFAAAKNADDRIAARPDDSSKSTAPALTAPALTAPALTSQSPTTAPEVIAMPGPQTSAPVAPAEASAYPVTSAPAARYPVSVPPANTYPTTSPAQPAAPSLGAPGGSGYQPQSQYAPSSAPPVDYRSQYPVTPASMPQQPAAQAWNAGQPASYPSYDTTARGSRNERTGSGTY